MVGRFESPFPNKTSRFHSSDEKDENEPPPPPPSFIMLEEEAASAISSLDPSPKLRRMVSESAKNRYRTLSQKSPGPMERGRMRVLRSDRMRTQRFRSSHEIREDEEAFAKKAAPPREERQSEEEEAIKLVKQKKEMENEMLCTHIELLYEWMKDHEQMVQRTKHLQEMEKERQAQAVSRIKNKKRREEQSLLNAQFMTLFAWLVQEEEEVTQIRRETTSPPEEEEEVEQLLVENWTTDREEEKESLSRRRVEQDEVEQEMLLTQHFVLLAWTREQEEATAARKAARKAQRSEQQALLRRTLDHILVWLSQQEAKQQAVKRHLQSQREQEVLSHCFSTYMSWTMRQEKLSKDRRRAAKRAKLRTEAEHYKLHKQLRILMHWTMEQEVLLQETRIRRSNESNLLRCQHHTLWAWSLQHEQETVALKAKRVEEARAAHLKLLEEQSLLRKTASDLSSWLYRLEARVRRQKEQDKLMNQYGQLQQWINQHAVYLDQERADMAERARLEKQRREAEQALVTQHASNLLAWLLQEQDMAEQRRAEKAQQALLRERRRQNEKRLLLGQWRTFTVWLLQQDQMASAKREALRRRVAEEKLRQAKAVEQRRAACRRVEQDLVIQQHKDLTSWISEHENQLTRERLDNLQRGKRQATSPSQEEKKDDECDMSQLAAPVAVGGIALLSEATNKTSVSSDSNIACKTTAPPPLVPAVVGRRSSTGSGLVVVANGRVRSTRGLRSGPLVIQSRRRSMDDSAATPKRKGADEDCRRNSSLSSIQSQNSTFELADESVTVSITKESKDAKTGISFKKDAQDMTVVSRIHPDGLFASTAMKVGFELVSINNVETTGKSLKEVAAMIRGAERSVDIVARPPQTFDTTAPAWPPVEDPGYLHAQQAGVLWQTLVGQHVNFPKAWWNGRAPQMGVLDVVKAGERLPQHVWKYITVDTVPREKMDLTKYVPQESSPGRLLLHLVIRDETWRPVQDVAIGCYYPISESSESTTSARTVWMGIRRRSAHESGSTSLIDPILSSECRIADIAMESPLGKNKRVHNRHLRKVFGKDPPVTSLFVLESELVKKVRGAMDYPRFPEVSMLLVDLFSGSN